MKKKIRITDEQILELAYKVGQPTKKFLFKKLEREVSKFIPLKDMDATDFVNLMITVMSNFDANILFQIEEGFKNITKHDMDFSKVTDSFINNLLHILQQRNKMGIIH